jgi:hypothetical protein
VRSAALALDIKRYRGAAHTPLNNWVQSRHGNSF